MADIELKSLTFPGLSDTYTTNSGSGLNPIIVVPSGVTPTSLKFIHWKTGEMQTLSPFASGNYNGLYACDYYKVPDFGALEWIFDAYSGTWWISENRFIVLVEEAGL